MEDLVHVDVVPLAVNFLWPHSWFPVSKRESSWNYRAQCGIIPLCQVLQNIASSIFAVCLREFSTVIKISLLFPVYNLTATLLECMHTEGSAPCC